MPEATKPGIAPAFSLYAQAFPSASGAPEQQTDIVNHRRRALPVLREQAQATFAVEDKSARAVIDVVAAVLDCLLLDVDLELLGRARSCLEVAGEAEESGMERRHVFLQHLLRVAFRID